MILFQPAEAGNATEDISLTEIPTQVRYNSLRFHSRHMQTKIKDEDPWLHHTNENVYESLDNLNIFHETSFCNRGVLRETSFGSINGYVNVKEDIVNNADVKINTDIKDTADTPGDIRLCPTAHLRGPAVLTTARSKRQLRELLFQVKLLNSNVIKKHDSQELANDYKTEWRLVALTLDRLLLCLFIIMTAFVITITFINIPAD